MKKFAKVAALMLVVVFALAVMVACGPVNDPEKAKAALEKNGYSAAVVKTGDVTTLTASKGLMDIGVTIVWHANVEDAKKAETEAKDALKKMEEQLKDSPVKIELVSGRSGKMVWMGTKEAVKAAR